MGNIISFDDKVSVGDDSLSMSNGLTDVFIDYLVLSGSQLADSESEKRMVVFLAEKQQAIVGMGTIGFEIIEMPWKSDSFENDKAFILHMIQHARALSLEQSVWEQLGYKPDQKLLEYALNSFEILIKRMTINNIDEKNLLEWLSASEIADPINSGFPKCPKHIVFEAGFPCEIQDKVSKVLGKMSLKTYNNISCGVSEEATKEEYVLLDGSTISFPYA